MSTPSTLNCGRAETLAEMQQIADAWRDDPDPYKGSVAQMFARAIVADGMPPGPLGAPRSSKPLGCPVAWTCNSTASAPRSRASKVATNAARRSGRRSPGCARRAIGSLTAAFGAR